MTTHMQEDYVVVFDTETQNSFADVIGSKKQKLQKLHVSVAAALCIPTRLCIGQTSAEEALKSAIVHTFWTKHEKDMTKMISLLHGATLVIGFNLYEFDYPVIRKYDTYDVLDDVCAKTLDVFSRVRDATGQWYKLNTLLEANNLPCKTSHGLEAIAMYEEGRLEELESYCVNDVKSTALLSLMSEITTGTRVLPNHVFGVSSMLAAINHSSMLNERVSACVQAPKTV